MKVHSFINSKSMKQEWYDVKWKCIYSNSVKQESYDVKWKYVYSNNVKQERLDMKWKYMYSNRVEQERYDVKWKYIYYKTINMAWNQPERYGLREVQLNNHIGKSIKSCIGLTLGTSSHPI